MLTCAAVFVPRGGAQARQQGGHPRGAAGGRRGARARARRRSLLRADCSRATIRACSRAAAQAAFENRGGHLPPPGSAAHDLLLALVTYDAAVRISASDALNHPYFTAPGQQPPSENALLGPQGERAGPYPRRTVEPLAVGAARKRKAEEDAAKAGAGASAAGAPAAAPVARPGVLVPGAAAGSMVVAAPPRRALPPAPQAAPQQRPQWD
jgi:hypothetical protein